MNCLFILVLLGCCGRNRGWNWNGNVCCDRVQRNNSCEREHEDTSCGCMRERHEESCGCSEHSDSRSMRYDEGMRSYARMDTVPEMRENMSRAYPIYPDSCGCNERK